MYRLVDQIKNFLIYDADKEFYAKVFPDSVPMMELMRIRRMTPTDLREVLIIENKNYQFPWEEDTFKDCFKAGYGTWICEVENKIVGYGLISIAAGEAHILNLSVDPKEQGQGVGRKLLEFMIRVAQGKAETVFLEVRPSNTHAIALYERLGFNEIGLRKAYYPAENGREDALMLALELFDTFR